MRGRCREAAKGTGGEPRAGTARAPACVLAARSGSRGEAGDVKGDAFPGVALQTTSIPIASRAAKGRTVARLAIVSDMSKSGRLSSAPGTPLTGQRRNLAVSTALIVAWSPGEGYHTVLDARRRCASSRRLLLPWLSPWRRPRPFSRGAKVRLTKPTELPHHTW